MNKIYFNASCYRSTTSFNKIKEWFLQKNIKHGDVYFNYESIEIKSYSVTSQFVQEFDYDIDYSKSMFESSEQIEPIEPSEEKVIIEGKAARLLILD